MVIKVEGVWHQANAEETATICGLDPDSLYGDLDYFAFEAINVTAEKV